MQISQSREIVKHIRAHRRIQVLDTLLAHSFIAMDEDLVGGEWLIVGGLEVGKYIDDADGENYEDVA